MPSSKHIFFGADHAGFRLKEHLKKDLTKSGWTVEDLTPTFVADDDYPAIGRKVAEAVVARDALGILVCGTGMGMDIAANRLRGARAVVIRTLREARLSREHNHANILVLGARLMSKKQAETIARVWLKTPYSKEKRHARRVKQLG